MPPGLAAWGGLNGGTIRNESEAAASTPSSTASVTAATGAQTTGGCYGFASGGDARFYIQTSSNTTNGANQLALAIDTTGRGNITLGYSLETISAQPRTVGVLCQFRVGSSGPWTSLTADAGENPFSQAGGDAGLKTVVSAMLPAIANNQPIVQIRWAVWRGTESGNSSGVAVDDISVTFEGDPWSAPAGYYDAAAGLDGVALKAALRIISGTGHQAFDYSSTLDPLREIHADPDDSARLITVYSGASIGRNEVFRPDAGLDPALTWSREHLWPVSYGLDPENINPGASNGDAGPDYTDLFNLQPCVHQVNSERGNLYFDESSGSITIPPLAPLCSRDGNSWEPRDSEKGDIARVMFYMATRYDGSDPGTLDLEIDESPSTSSGRFAKLSTLLAWHQLDPVDDTERQRHQLTASLQGNRNPFVDQPEFVGRIWGDPPGGPASLPVVHGGPWSPLPGGFLGEGTGTYTSSLGDDTAPGSARFDSSGERLVIAFSGTPATLAYRLRGNPSPPATSTAGSFLVSQSSDGVVFTPVRSHIDKDNSDQAFVDLLDSSSRFVAFTLETKLQGNIQLDSLRISPTAGAWQDWLDFHQLSGNAAGALFDGDGDGFPNLLEFVLGGQPDMPDPGISPRLMGVYAAPELVFDRHRESLPHASLTVQWSDDLTGWTDIPVAPTSSGSTTVTEKPGGVDEVRVAIPPGFPRFIRLRATAGE